MNISKSSISWNHCVEGKDKFKSEKFANKFITYTRSGEQGWTIQQNDRC